MLYKTFFLKKELQRTKKKKNIRRNEMKEKFISKNTFDSKIRYRNNHFEYERNQSNTL